MADQDIKKEILDSVKKRMDVPGFLSDMIKGVGDKALRAAAAKTDTKLDDLLVATIGPTLEDEIVKFLTEKYNSLFSGGEPVL